MTLVARVPSAACLLLALGAGGVVAQGKGTTYLYTYYDRSGRIVINNLPPSYMRGQGLTLKHVGVGHVRLAVSKGELARALKSPELIALVDEIAVSQGVDPFLARAIIQAESAFNYRARSHAGALGLMQLMPSTAERFGVTDPFDPRQNIVGGTKYLKWLSDYYKGDVRKVIAAYNAGEGAVNKYGGVPPYRETQAYVPKVMDLYSRRLVQPDPKAAGAMALLKKGRGGFLVEERPVKESAEAGESPRSLPAEVPKAPVVTQTAQLRPRGNSRIFQWTDASGRLQISDQAPPKGSRNVRIFDGAQD